MAIIKIKDDSGNIYSIPSVTGPQGPKGDKPIKGIDYWTTEDRAEIVAELEATLGGSSNEPEIIDKDTVADALSWLEANGNTAKTYVLPDGYVYAYIETTSYTNMLPIATGEDGKIYNGIGYAVNKRWSTTSGMDIESIGTYITGYIPYTRNSILRLKNITMLYTEENNTNCVISFFSDFGTFISSFSGADIKNKLNGIYDENGNLLQLSLGAVEYKYFRLQSSYMGEDSIITINEEISDELVYVWKSTGLKYDFSDVIDELTEKTQLLTDELNELKDKISSSDNENSLSVPSYWQTHVDARVDKIRETMEIAGRNKSAFLFYSDAHWDSGSQKVPKLLNYLTANTAINKTIFGGDIVSTEPTAETLSDRSIMKYLWDWRTQIRNLKHYSVIGNHDDGNNNTTTGGATNSIFDADYVYSFLFAPEENNNIVRGDDTYYYFDDNREQTRYLCVDTAYESQFSLSTTQTEFIKEALKNTPENWHVVVVAHIWYNPDYTQYDVRPIPLTGLTDSALQLTQLLDNYNSRSGEFADCKAKVEFGIGGHVHRDYAGTTAGGIPIVTVDCAGLGYRGSFTATNGTTSETAVSGVVADYDNNKLSIIRVGRGNSFEIDLTTGSSSDITQPEIPDTPSTPTYTNVLETVGYQTGYRVNSSGAVLERSDRCVTGLIKVNVGDTIYFKNITMLGSDYGRSVAHYDSTQTFISGKSYVIADDNEFATWYDDGTMKSFKITEVNTNWVRFCFVKIDDTSIISVNNPITD